MPAKETRRRRGARTRHSPGAGRAVICACRRLATVDLTGRLVESVQSRGEHLLMRFAHGWTLHSPLRMDGAWQVYQQGQAWRGGPAPDRAILRHRAGARRSATGCRARTGAHRRGGEGHRPPRPRPARSGLGRGDAAQALRRLAAEPDRSIGEALLDQRNLAGIGNVYKSELCFVSGLTPCDAVADVPDLGRMVELAHRLLVATRPADAVTTGRPGPATLWVYGAAAGVPALRNDDPQRGPGPGRRGTDDLLGARTANPGRSRRPPPGAAGPEPIGRLRLASAFLEAKDLGRMFSGPAPHSAPAPPPSGTAKTPRAAPETTARPARNASSAPRRTPHARLARTVVPPGSAPRIARSASLRTRRSDPPPRPNASRSSESAAAPRPSAGGDVQAGQPRPGQPGAGLLVRERVPRRLRRRSRVSRRGTRRRADGVHVVGEFGELFHHVEDRGQVADRVDLRCGSAYRAQQIGTGRSACGRRGPPSGREAAPRSADPIRRRPRRRLPSRKSRPSRGPVVVDTSGCAPCLAEFCPHGARCGPRAAAVCPAGPVTCPPPATGDPCSRIRGRPATRGRRSPPARWRAGRPPLPRRGRGTGT